jgi:serine/threonine protein kinase
MSPELFLSGRVSKASDVYSFGVCVYELVTGMRAFSGVPLPLLPHEVAVVGLRPEWPRDVGPCYSRLQSMAEACWAQDACDRWVWWQHNAEAKSVACLPAAFFCNQSRQLV